MAISPQTPARPQRIEGPRAGRPSATHRRTSRRVHRQIAGLPPASARRCFHRARRLLAELLAAIESAYARRPQPHPLRCPPTTAQGRMTATPTRFAGPLIATSALRRYPVYQKPTLSLSQTRNAMNAMLDKAMQELDRPLAIAIVDADAKMLSYARMDNCRALPQRMAVSKAYTSAMSGSDSDAYAQRLKNEGRNIADFGDSSLVAVQGAVVVRDPGTDLVLGAIGVSGLSAQEDEDLARLGLNALGL